VIKKGSELPSQMEGGEKKSNLVNKPCRKGLKVSRDETPDGGPGDSERGTKGNFSVKMGEEPHRRSRMEKKKAREFRIIKEWFQMGVKGGKKRREGGGFFRSLRG